MRYSALVLTGPSLGRFVAPYGMHSLLASIRRIPPDAFERLCQRALRESGFIKVEVTGRSGDGGIDGAGVLRPNLLSFPGTVSACHRLN